MNNQNQGYPPNQEYGHPQQVQHGAPNQGYNQPQVNNNTVVVVQTKVFPTLSSCAAVVVLILNIFLPGVGTMVMGCMAGDAASNWICIGFAQMILAPCIVGWVWAIITGCQAIANSSQNGQSTVVVGHGGNVIAV